MKRTSTFGQSTWDRRRWLQAVALGGFLSTARAEGDPEGEAEEAKAIEAVKARGEKAGLSGFQVSRSPHYLGIGNAPERFRSTALSLCEGLADDYLEHFKARDFQVEMAPKRLGVVILENNQAFVKYLDEVALKGVAGIYELGANRLVMCDNRDGRNPLAERTNTFTLMHEATHQLTYNTGLLDRQGDVPRLIDEGLGCYAETRRPGGQVKIGAVNRERLAVLASVAARGGSLTPVARLLHDEPFLNVDTAVTSYSEAWLFIHMLMSDKTLAKAFSGYLDAIRPRRTAERRKADMETHLGKLDDLDAAMKSHANRLLR